MIQKAIKPRPFLKPSAAARRIGVSADTIIRWGKAQKFTLVRPGGHWLIEPASFERFMTSLPVRSEGLAA